VPFFKERQAKIRARGNAPGPVGIRYYPQRRRRTSFTTRQCAGSLEPKQQYQIIYTDITDRVEAEKALKLSERNFRNSMESSAIGIRISDNKEHTRMSTKRCWISLAIRISTKSRSSPPQEHYSLQAHADWVLRHEKLLRGEPMPKQVDIDIIRKDGTVRNLTVFHDGYLLGWRAAAPDSL